MQSFDTHGPRPVRGWAPFALGFRPFFFCAGAAAVLLLALWLAIWSGVMPPNPYYGITGWHSHEMLFAYTAAVMAGFLLTAVRNWTGIDTLTGRGLAALAALWLVGRILPFLPLPGALIALVDLAFLPLVAFALAGPLIKGKQKVNRIFLPVLGIGVVANLLVHLEALGVTSATASRGTGLMLNLILLLILLVTGRVMPFFTESSLPGATPANRQTIEGFSFGLLIALAAAELFFPFTWLVGILAALLALSQIIRVSGWYDHRIWSQPILWVLYTGYFWLIAGFALQALSSLGLLAPNLALHALTVGGIGVLTLGMMARVSLGHTGRPMRAAKSMQVAFILLNIGAALRVLAPVALPQWYSHWIHLSGGLWIVSFLIFSVVYMPILVRPRIDGMPG